MKNFYNSKIQKTRSHDQSELDSWFFQAKISLLSYSIRLTLSVDKFFTAIKDGKWHTIDDLSSQLALPTRKLTEFAEFLFEKGLLKSEDKTRRIRLEPIWRLLLPEEEPTRSNITVATLVIPPEATVDVQSTLINNLSNIELEVNLRIDDRIREIAIKI